MLECALMENTRTRRTRENESDGIDNQGLSVLIIIEAVILGLVAVGVFAFLFEQYEEVQHVTAEREQEAQATQVHLALLASTPPTPTASATSTQTATRTNTLTPTRTNTPTITSTPTTSPTPTITPTPTNSPTPTRTFTPRPTATVTPLPVTTLKNCDTIDEGGRYRLGADISAAGDCIKIQASGVTLDCQGHSIRGANFGGAGIGIRKYGLLGSQTPQYVEVKNCRVAGFKYGIWVEAGKLLVIRDNDASGNYDDVEPATRYGIFLGMTDGGGIRVNHTADSQIIGNTTTRQAIGIDVRNSTNVRVAGNTASDNSAWGINLIRTTASTVESNATADNIRKCTWGAGVIGFGCDAGGIMLQDGTSGNIVANNNVTGRNGNGIFIKAHGLPCGNNNQLIGNTITGFLYNGVELSFCTGNKINNNTIRDGLDGIWLGFASGNEVRGNTISNMGNHGVVSVNSHGNNVTGNNFFSNREAIFFYTENYDRAALSFLPPGDYRSHSNCLCGNTFTSNSVGVHLLDSTSNQVTNNTFQNNGRSIWFQGNADGNNTQGNVGALTGEGAVARRE